MRQHEKYQTICDYAPTISHDMSVTHDIKCCETPMQKLQEITRTAPTKCYQMASIFWWVPFLLSRLVPRLAKA